MRDGRWANARVERVAIDGGEWTVKDFSSRPFLARNVLGRFLVRRELAALNRLAGLPGVPADAFRLDAHAIAARYLPGTTLAKLPPGRVSTAFLEALRGLKRLLESFDLSGVYKKWAQWQPESLGESRRALFERTTRWRRYWIFRGYLGVRK